MLSSSARALTVSGVMRVCGRTFTDFKSDGSSNVWGDTGVTDYRYVLDSVSDVTLLKEQYLYRPSNVSVVSNQD